MKHTHTWARAILSLYWIQRHKKHQIPVWAWVSGCSGHKGLGGLLSLRVLFCSRPRSPSTAAKSITTQIFKKMFPFHLAWIQMFSSYSVIPEGARFQWFHCSFRAPSWLQVKMVVVVTHTKASLWRSRDLVWAKEVHTDRRGFRDVGAGRELDGIKTCNGDDSETNFNTVRDQDCWKTVNNKQVVKKQLGCPLVANCSKTTGSTSFSLQSLKTLFTQKELDYLKMVAGI